MRKVYDVVFYGGKYRDRDGNERPRYKNCGSVYIDQEGRRKICLDAIPPGASSESGSIWFDCYEPRDDNAPRPQAQAPRAQARTQAPRAQAQRPPDPPPPDDFEDDIPF